MKLFTVTLLMAMTMAFQFDQDFNQIHKLFEQRFNEMKDISNQLREKDNFSVQWSFGQVEQVSTDYDKCLVDLEHTLDLIVEMTRKALKKQYNELMPLAMRFVTDMTDVVQCFMHPEVTKILKDRRECVRQHLQKFVEEVRTGVTDVMHGNWEKAQEDFRLAVNTLQDIQNC